MNQIFNKSLFAQDLIRLSKRCNEEDLYIHDFSASIVCDKLNSISKTFKNGLIYGIIPASNFHNKVEKITHANIAKSIHLPEETIIFDEEYSTVNSSISKKYDLISTNLTMQYSNDIVGSLIQYYSILEQKGMFICNILGGKTLNELRTCMLKTDLKLFGKVCPRIIPMIEIKQMGSLMQRAGFDIPFCSSDNLIVEYSNIKTLLYDIKNMAFGNYMHNREWQYNRNYFKALEEVYKQEFSTDGRIKATFDIITAFGSKS